MIETFGYSSTAEAIKAVAKGKVREAFERVVREEVEVEVQKLVKELMEEFKVEVEAYASADRFKAIELIVNVNKRK